ncbi:MAG: 3-hydroxybutyryl-CoA dehydrogenase [Solirubrobacteraceae bacterium]|nr:3-hydroxybutyryl-CoA dehydrogenase [Solirubrobacteraceae bacterium]
MHERLAIAGAGTIACGLAATAARHGDVVLWARSDASADRARASVAKLCAKAGAPEAAERVTVATDQAALHGETFIVEAVVEDPDHKAPLLAELGVAADPGAILATTTSSLSIGELAAASGRPERFVGLHVFNPVARMELIELVFPDQAQPEVRDRARALCEALGKTAVEVPDTPGFVVNRLLFPYLFDAVNLMTQTGLSPADIDRCMTLGAGMPMGPLALLDFVGLDVSQAIGESIGTDVPPRVRELVQDGALGRKVGRGFYDYS